MILKKIIIKDQKELYRHKNYLLGLDLEFNISKKDVFILRPPIQGC